MLLRPSSLGMSLALSRKLSHCHTLHITLSHERRDLILAKLSESPWWPDTDTSRQLQAGCGEIIFVLWTEIRPFISRQQFYCQLRFKVLLTNGRFKCPLHILQTDMGILCCGISSFINIGSAPLASINQTQYDPFLPSTRNVSGYKYNMALTRDLMMCNSSLRQSESNVSSQLPNMLLVYWP